MVTEAFRELYPYRSHSLRLGNLRYHFLDEGEGEPLLMLHGNPTWSFHFRNLILGLRHKFRCVVPDHMGCGLSDKPLDYNYTLAQHIDNVEALADALKLKDLTLVMHDWGGAIGMGFAVRRPECVKRLVLFNTAAFLSGRIPFSIDVCRHPAFGPFAVLKLNAFLRGALLRAPKHKDRMTREVKAGYLAPYPTADSRIAILRFVQDIPMTPEVPSHSVVRDMQEKLTQFRDRPALIIWGKKDFCFTDHFLTRWKEFLPQAQVEEVADAGHFVVEDAYERIVPWMLAFLERHPVR